MPRLACNNATRHFGELGLTEAGTHQIRDQGSNDKEGSAYMCIDQLAIDKRLEGLSPQGTMACLSIQAC